VNQNGLNVHANLLMANKFAFASHLSHKIKDFMMEQLTFNVSNHGKTLVTCEGHHVREMQVE